MIRWSVREVRSHLSQVIEDLPETGPVLITKNGKGRALLIPVDDDADLETLILSNSPRFWELFDRAARSKTWTALDEL